MNELLVAALLTGQAWLARCALGFEQRQIPRTHMREVSPGVFLVEHHAGPFYVRQLKDANQTVSTGR